MDNINECLFCKSNYCLLEQKKCNKRNVEKCDILTKYKNKKNRKGEDIWKYNKTLRCKKCGHLGAIQYQ